MNRYAFTLAIASLVGLAGAADAKIPFLNATCPGGIEVHADEGGPIFINGHQAQTTKFNGEAYEAKHANKTIDLTVNPDGTAMVTYTLDNGANGICNVSGGGGGCPADVSEADRYKYPACN